MRITKQELHDFVVRTLRIAEDAALCIKFSQEKAHYFEELQANNVSDIPRFSRMEVGYGAAAWATILFVDLRNSSRRAEQHGARATYLTMHAYLPTMAYLVKRTKAHIVGFRGDGLFAAFGLDETGNNPATLNHGEVVRSAVRCAKSMIEAVEQVVEPVLVEDGVPGDLRIGVGIDAGQVVITRIGLQEACEVTAYGTCVNKAAHYSDMGNGEVVISNRAHRLYPKSENGTMRFKPHIHGEGLKIVYPTDYRVIGELRQVAHK